MRAIKDVAAIAVAVTVSACTPRIETHPRQASELTCTMLYEDFSSNVDLAIAANTDGNTGEALYRMSAAEMNLDVLLARDCCRFDATCPAIIQF